MDLFTLCGFLTGGLIILGSLVYCGINMGQLIQPDALLIVFGGSLTATLIQCRGGDVKLAWNAARSVLRKPDYTPLDVADIVVDAAQFIRAKGFLAMQPLLEDVDLPILKNGLQMLIDNQEPVDIQAKLTTQVDMSYQQDNRVCDVFDVAGGVAPTMGILGAIVGLIHISNLLQHPEQLGIALAGAFSATLYGVGLANLFLLPMAGKLRQRAKDQWVINTMIVSGIQSIMMDDHPTVIREKLEAYLPQADIEDWQPNLMDVRPARQERSAEIDWDNALRTPLPSGNR